LWSLEEQRNRADLLEVFKMVKGFSAVSWSQFLLSHILPILVDITGNCRRNRVYIFSLNDVYPDGTVSARKQLIHQV